MKSRIIAKAGILALGLGIGAGWAQMPFAAADSSSDAASAIDSLLSGLSPAQATASDFQISFNGMDLFSTAGNEATATTIAGQYGLAIAYGDGASATAEGGTGDYALASGTNALANAGSLTAGATGFNSDYAEDIGNNTRDATTTGAPDGAYAGGGSLIGATDSSAASSNNYAVFIGNGGVDSETAASNGGLGDGGNSGAFAGDGNLIHVGGAGNGDTAFTFGNLNGFGDGSASVDGSNNYAGSSGSQTGTNEGAFAGLGNNNTAVADTSYTTDGDGVSTIYGNNNIAYVAGPTNSTAAAGGTGPITGSPNAEVAGNYNIAYVNDPFGTTADSATAGSTNTAAGSNDLAEVLLTHGAATADGGNMLYDILSLFGPFTNIPG